MKLQVYGSHTSTCTRKVLVTLVETGTPFELIELDVPAGEHKRAAHLARQPFGHITALEDGDFMLFESHPMCRYIAEKAGSSLVPADLRGRSLMEQWMSVEAGELTHPAMTFVAQAVFGRPVSPDMLELAGMRLEATIAVLEARLARSPYLSGPAITVADLCFLPHLAYARRSAEALAILTRHPHVMAWLEHMSARPSWRQVGAES